MEGVTWKCDNCGSIFGGEKQATKCCKSHAIPIYEAEPLDNFSPHVGNIVPRNQHPPKIGNAKGTELAFGGGMHDAYRVVVMCFSCNKNIYISYADPNRKPVPCGDYEVPKTCNDPCPECGGKFARMNGKTGAAQYLTSHGLI